MACGGPATAAQFVVKCGAPLVAFLGGADAGLCGALASFLGAAGVFRLALSSRWARALLANPADGVCCPHLRPRSVAALAAGVFGCDAAQLRSLRPPEELSSAQILRSLAIRLRAFVGLEELGPVLCIDPSEEYFCDDPLPSSLDGEAGSGELTVSHLLPSVAEALEGSRRLSKLDLTLRCEDRAAAISLVKVLLPAVGGCRALRELQLDVDCTLEYGGKVLGGLVRMLQRMGEQQRLESLSLGYLWWSEASDDVQSELKAALQRLGGSVRKLAIRYAQDPELGGLGVAALSMVRGAAEGLEEVLILEGWGDDGAGLPELTKVLGECLKLRRVELAGSLPFDFDRSAFEASVRCGRFLPIVVYSNTD